MCVYIFRDSTTSRRSRGLVGNVGIFVCAGEPGEVVIFVVIFVVVFVVD